MADPVRQCLSLRLTIPRKIENSFWEMISGSYTLAGFVSVEAESGQESIREEPQLSLLPEKPELQRRAILLSFSMAILPPSVHSLVQFIESLL